MRTRFVALPDEAGLVPTPLGHLHVEAVVRDVSGAALEPGRVDRPLADVKVVAHVLRVPLHGKRNVAGTYVLLLVLPSAAAAMPCGEQHGCARNFCTANLSCNKHQHPAQHIRHKRSRKDVLQFRLFRGSAS